MDATLVYTHKDYAVGWVTLMLLNATLAHALGRSRFAWLLVSLFLGPVATFLLMLFGRIRTKSF